MSDQQYAMWVKRSAYFTLAMSLTIVLLKLYASIETNASAMLASFTDAMLDVLVSGLNFFALRYALRPADDEHRFGHGKAEAVMALCQAAFLTGAAVLLLYQGVSRIFTPEPVEQVMQGVGITLICMMLTLSLVLVQRWIIAKTGSLAVQADSAHYRGDLLMNAAVLAALLLVSYGIVWADAVFTALIAGYLCINAWQLAGESMRHLLDEELPTAQRELILQTLRQVSGVVAVDQLRTRQGGPHIFIQCRLVLPDAWSLQQAHDVVDGAEQQIANLFPKADVIIHADPQSAIAEPEYRF